jgi:pilus assembly protein CpaE
VLFRSISTPSTPSNGQAHRGKIISFCSAKGGTGTTSVCVNAAYALARLETRAQICVVDMALPLGTIGRAIGYESPMTVARLTSTLNGNLNRETVKVFISAEPEYGFHVLLSANNLKEASTFDSSKMGALFETLRQMYDYILVDFGRSLSCANLSIIETSDAVSIVLTPDPSAVKMTKLVLQHLESLNLPRHRLVPVSNRAAGNAWMSKEEIENELGLALVAAIPHELDYVTTALNAGIPFMAKYPERAASKVFTDFARTLVERMPK